KLASIKQRWTTLLKEWFDPRTELFDTSKIADVMDMLRYELIHHHNVMTPRAFALAVESHKIMLPIHSFSGPAESGITDAQKLRIGAQIVGKLVRKIVRDLTFFRSVDQPRLPMEGPSTTATFTDWGMSMTAACAAARFAPPPGLSPSPSPLPPPLAAPDARGASPTGGEGLPGSQLPVRPSLACGAPGDKSTSSVGYGSVTSLSVSSSPSSSTPSRLFGDSSRSRVSSTAATREKTPHGFVSLGDVPSAFSSAVSPRGHDRDGDAGPDRREGRAPWPAYPGASPDFPGAPPGTAAAISSATSSGASASPSSTSSSSSGRSASNGLLSAAFDRLRERTLATTPPHTHRGEGRGPGVLALVGAPRWTAEREESPTLQPPLASCPALRQTTGSSPSGPESSAMSAFSSVCSCVSPSASGSQPPAAGPAPAYAPLSPQGAETLPRRPAASSPGSQEFFRETACSPPRRTGSDGERNGPGGPHLVLKNLSDEERFLQSLSTNELFLKNEGARTTREVADAVTAAAADAAAEAAPTASASFRELVKAMCDDDAETSSPRSSNAHGQSSPQSDSSASTGESAASPPSSRPSDSRSTSAPHSCASDPAQRRASPSASSPASSPVPASPQTAGAPSARSGDAPVSSASASAAGPASSPVPGANLLGGRLSRSASSACCYSFFSSFSGSAGRSATHKGTSSTRGSSTGSAGGGPRLHGSGPAARGRSSQKASFATSSSSRASSTRPASASVCSRPAGAPKKRVSTGTTERGRRDEAVELGDRGKAGEDSSPLLALRSESPGGASVGKKGAEANWAVNGGSEEGEKRGAGREITDLLASRFGLGLPGLGGDSERSLGGAGHEKVVINSDELWAHQKKAKKSEKREEKAPLSLHGILASTAAGALPLGSRPADLYGLGAENGSGSRPESSRSGSRGGQRSCSSGGRDQEECEDERHERRRRAETEEGVEKLPSPQSAGTGAAGVARRGSEETAETATPGKRGEGDSAGLGEARGEAKGDGGEEDGESAGAECPEGRGRMAGDSEGGGEEGGVRREVADVDKEDAAGEKKQSEEDDGAEDDEDHEEHEDDDPHEHEVTAQIRLKEEEARMFGIRSPWRIVRSRYYVTSASHVQALLNILLFSYEVVCVKNQFCPNCAANARGEDGKKKARLEKADGQEKEKEAAAGREDEGRRRGEDRERRGQKAVHAGEAEMGELSRKERVKSDADSHRQSMCLTCATPLLDAGTDHEALGTCDLHYLSHIVFRVWEKKRDRASRGALSSPQHFSVYSPSASAYPSSPAGTSCSSPLFSSQGKGGPEDEHKVPTAAAGSVPHTPQPPVPASPYRLEISFSTGAKDGFGRTFVLIEREAQAHRQRSLLRAGRHASDSGRESQRESPPHAKTEAEARRAPACAVSETAGLSAKPVETGGGEAEDEARKPAAASARGGDPSSGKMGTECRSGGGPWATSQDTDGKREGPSGFARKPAYPSPGASASVKALLKRGLHAEEEEDYLDVQQQELCYYAHAPISAYSASPGAEGAGKASSSFVSGQACECACCMERRSEHPAETCGAAASADSGAVTTGPACSGCPCCRAGKTASSGVQHQADESSTGRQGETEEPGFAASLPSRRAANSAGVTRERGPQTGPAGERTEDEGREGKDSREDLPAQSRNAENGAPLVGAVVPPYCELAPLVSLSQSCVLERFEALMNKVSQLCQLTARASDRLMQTLCFLFTRIDGCALKRIDARRAYPFVVAVPRLGSRERMPLPTDLHSRVRIHPPLSAVSRTHKYMR
ncbi:histidine acid phosphatase superfamily protein, partial [Toxoplasma gondii VAND]